MTDLSSSNRVSLRQALEQQITSAHATYIPSVGKSLAEALADDAAISDVYVVISTHDLAKPIIQHMLADEHFRTLEGKMLELGNGRSSIHPQFIAPLLLQYAIRSSSETALTWLDTALQTQTATGLLILTIWGIRVENPIQIAPDLTLMPTAQLPDSRAKELLGNVGTSQNLMTCFDFELPATSLVHHYAISQVIRHENDELDNGNYLKIQEKLYEIASIIGLLGPQLSIPAMSWFQFDDPGVERLQLGSPRSQRMIELIPLHIPQAQYLNPQEVVELINAYLALEPAMAERVGVATERLSLALRRHNPADRAVELSIALESLLTDQATNEVTHKVKVRATRMMGGNEEDRAFNFGIIGRTYDIRSMLVHTGKRESKPKRVNGSNLTPEEITKHCSELCAKLIKKIIFARQFPDWSIFDVS